METGIIDKLFLELSQITKAKTKKELAMEVAIRGALRIKQLWMPDPENTNMDNFDEAVALNDMLMDFEYCAKLMDG